MRALGPRGYEVSLRVSEPEIPRGGRRTRPGAATWGRRGQGVGAAARMNLAGDDPDSQPQVSDPPRPPRAPQQRTEPLYASPSVPTPCPPGNARARLCVCVWLCGCARSRDSWKRGWKGRGWEPLPAAQGLPNKTWVMPALLSPASTDELVLSSF